MRSMKKKEINGVCCVNPFQMKPHIYNGFFLQDFNWHDSAKKKTYSMSRSFFENKIDYKEKLLQVIHFNRAARSKWALARSF